MDNAVHSGVVVVHSGR